MDASDQWADDQPIAADQPIADGRTERLAAALRANLRRRKTHAGGAGAAADDVRAGREGAASGADGDPRTGGE